ncbi:hypothetical protein [Bacteroides fragilis]|nr:hypothetical protein [Bacteroides fragilis]MDA1486381.1 hypothetical protein [Bacteroides fragilis]
MESHAHVNGKPRSRKWKGTLTLLESHAHVNGKVRSRKWKNDPLTANFPV